MASLAFVQSTSRRRLPLARIDAVVSARLGPTRVPGNAQPACFNRQVAMYLAKHVAGWSTTCIGRFYNGRDHSTVIHAIQRIQALREGDSDVDALLSELNDQLARSDGEGEEEEVLKATDKLRNESLLDIEELVEKVAERLWARIAERLQK